MTASKGPVCLQVIDGYSDFERKGNRKEMVHIMNVPIKTKRYFVSVHLSIVVLECNTCDQCRVRQG